MIETITEGSHGSEEISDVLNTSLQFSDFQELALYHADGLFEKQIDFRGKSMPMLPQTLTPFFGIAFANLAIATYTALARNYRHAPCFLGLGAGRGYLDHDMIDYITGDRFNFSPYHEDIERIATDNAVFVVSDRTERAVELLHTELSDLAARPGMNGRINIQKMNAMDFDFGKLSSGQIPLGIVYANELIDAMPTEPIVKREGRLYSVRVRAYLMKGEGEDDEILPEEKLKTVLDSGDAEKVRSEPFFIALEYVPDIERRVNDLSSFSNIDRPNFGDIYPLHIGLDGLFESVLRSFEHGTIILIDYPVGEDSDGTHNWGSAMRKIVSSGVGQKDIDFQIDPDQVIEKATEHGMRLGLHMNVAELLDAGQGYLGMLGQKDYERWALANMGDVEAAVMAPMMYPMNAASAKRWDVMCFTF